ncbi:helicase and polymerase-containing protein TEBICHI isoform X4 [Magnolia sinica]|uniref:helicase and polymerase-containing protein TEBICHI isoform X4 n=1 Tax=Magnolia sinica TaxID=86752 RepID=UPI002659B1F4|nr:helicase and polymerase-containing protein TEBICHI isoform X4 [Magnolia sinica]
MTSGSPRNRIDQFFTSKKKKTLSPGLKAEKTDKDAKIILDGSPSTKSTLDSFLVSPHHDKSPVKPSKSDHGAVPRQDPVKRNLTLEIDLASEVAHKPVSLLTNFRSPVHCQKADVLREPQKEASSEKSDGDIGSNEWSDVVRGSRGAGEVATCSPEEEMIAIASGKGNLELRQFAADFLSLYCSEVPANEQKLNRQKRNGSPSLLAVDSKTSKKKHCISDHNHSQTCSDRDYSEHVKSGSSHYEEIEGTGCKQGKEYGSTSVELYASSRKCNPAPNSSVIMAECVTPGPSTNVTSNHETPNWACRSSIISPGDAFWNEAIQIADGLFGPFDKFSVQASKTNKVIEGQHERGSTCVIESGRGIGNSAKLAETDTEPRHMGLNTSMELSEKLAKDNGKLPAVVFHKVSPLPVRHFDFSHEERNSDENAQPQCLEENMKDVTPIGNGLSNSLTRCTALRSKQNNSEGELIPSLPISLDMDQKFAALAGNGEMCQILDDASASSIGDGKGGLPRQENVLEKETKNSSFAYCKYDEATTPSSSRALNVSLLLSSWLPSEICSIYMKRGISKLYPWQVECLQVDGVLQKRNLVYCASTSAGKSFVAEILMLRRVISTGKMALLVLPYVSICAEKAEHLEGILEPLGKHVRSFYGNQGGGTLPKDTSVAVCTIEKANSLVNRLLEDGRLSEVGIIVIDELHMVGDQNRGYLLELMLTKLRYAAGEGNTESSSGDSSGTSSGKADPAHGLQIVGMSATMPNVAAVADWLQAALYQTDFRPVPLEEYFKVGNAIYNKKMELVRTIPKNADLGGKDPDNIVELCNEVVQEGHSVLIFCSSRKGCESTAKHVAKFLKEFSVSTREGVCEFSDSSSAIEALRKCPAGLDPILEETLHSGVAYHHAGLTVEEREIVETCYRRGLVRVLTATSTLAAGVNLPARRVIFRQPRIGRDFIDGTRYKQMAGRAGRTGIDTRGESILICKPEEVKRIAAVLNDNCPPLQSCLSEDKNGMTHAILEVVAGGIVQTANDIHRYVRCTLLNSTKPFQDVVKSAQDSLRWLCHRKFLEWNEETKLYSTTPLGRASFGSSLCPEESLVVLDDLSRAREGFVLSSDLHLVYLVTPINVDVEPDWELYYEKFMQLSVLDQEVSVVDVCEAFKVSRGMVQALQENAGRFALMVSLFCERLGWNDLEGLVAKFQNRVSFGVRAEIVELTNIPYVKGSRARALYKAGLRTPLAIAEASLSEIVKALFESSSWASQEGSTMRRVQLGVAKKIKNGARKIVLDQAEEARVAAFSAFKSLGVLVPQLSQPLLPTAIGNSIMQEGVNSIMQEGGNSIMQEGGMVSSSEGTTSGFGNKQPNEDVQLAPSISEAEGNKKLCDLAQDHRIIELICESNTSMGIAGEVNSIGAMQYNCKDGASGTSIEVPALYHGPEFKAIINNTKNSESSFCQRLGNHCNSNRTPNGHLDNEEHEGNREKDLSNCMNGSITEKGPVNANNVPGGFDSFLDLWETISEFYFDVHFTKRSEQNTSVQFEIHGIAICWENSPVYYVSLSKDLISSDKLNLTGSCNDSCGTAAEDNTELLAPSYLWERAKHRWSRIAKIMECVDVRKVTWNLKAQIQVFKNPGVSIHKFGRLSLEEKERIGIKLRANSYLWLPSISVKDAVDMCVVVWILWPDEESSSTPNLEKEVKKRLSGEAAAAANRDGRWRNQMRRAAHNGCCRRAAQTRALGSVLWKLLISENLVEAVTRIESPLVEVLADMELWGIGVDMDACFRARHILGKKLKQLEKEAYSLAGMTFSLYTSADIANVLFRHLKLPISEGHSKGKKHPSTDKHSLDLLRHQHPIISVIREHRTLAKLLNSTLGSMCSRAKLCVQSQKYTVHGHWLQTSTATGRLSMEEPNLQCVEHMVDFKVHQNDKNSSSSSDAVHHQINPRDFFIPTQDDWLLLTADYSQIELRLMAHFSQDSSLIELLSRPDGDVFTMMAARWTGQQESTLSSRARDQTKRLVYGILYGMGANTLAEQLECSSDEAAEKIRSFKSSFPGVSAWLHYAVMFCRQKGYIETLMGRKRFLSKIKLGNNKEKAKAQRQAVNSICQGSAADIIKIAMINIHSIVVKGCEAQNSSTAWGTKFSVLRGRCRILLQVHDELVLEVDPSLVREAGLLLKTAMESAASLLVPLRVKLKVGRTWGSLEPFEADLTKEQVLVQCS